MNIPKVIPENNPEVMTKLAHRLGLSNNLAFYDVYSVTDEDLLALVPRTCHALLWLFPITEASEAALAEDEVDTKQYNSSGSNEPVLWFHQTIGHACGLIGLLHCITNGVPATHITPGSDLDKLTRAAIPVKPKERSDVLYNSEILEIAHREAAEQGDSRVPDPGEDVPYGFTAFVRGRDGRLYELEGRRKGPADRGLIGPEEDILSERVLGLSVYPYINREKVTETRFSCIALCDSQNT
jgi:ubiquitin carboxyl-terminal hydrolase L3